MSADPTFALGHRLLRTGPTLKAPIYGLLALEVYHAILARYDHLRAASKAAHRPPSLDSFVQQLYIVHAVETLKALDPARKIRGDIAKQVAKHYGVSETWVFAARAALDPKLRATIETQAKFDGAMISAGCSRASITAA
jgi:hypothetical protein